MLNDADGYQGGGNAGDEAREAEGARDFDFDAGDQLN
jgi:hypothetical protein